MVLALFVLSNDTHARMFAPVARELDQVGWRSVGMSLDAWYDQDATATATSMGLEVLSPAVRRPAPTTSFYGRLAPLVVFDAVRARGSIRRAITARDPSVLVVGNDRGLLEKAALDAARRIGASTILVQDGTIVRGVVEERAIRRRLWRTIRRVLSAMARPVGLRSLVATEYGTWGCDLLCVSGPAAKQVFIERGVPPDRIVETGQPRYDGQGRSTATARCGVVWFTTPFASQNLGNDRQHAQIELAAEVAAACTTAGIPFAIRPHPRDDVRQYDRAITLGAEMRTGGDAGAVLAAAEAAVMGISTVVDEAAILGVPVMITSGPIADRGLDELLPPPDRYPRVSSGADVIRLAAMWRANPGARNEVLRRQEAWVRERILIDWSEPASRRVAKVIRRVGSEARP